MKNMYSYLVQIPQNYSHLYGEQRRIECNQELNINDIISLGGISFRFYKNMSWHCLQEVNGMAQKNAYFTPYSV